MKIVQKNNENFKIQSQIDEDINGFEVSIDKPIDGNHNTNIYRFNKYGKPLFIRKSCLVQNGIVRIVHWGTTGYPDGEEVFCAMNRKNDFETATGETIYVKNGIVIENDFYVTNTENLKLLERNDTEIDSILSRANVINFDEKERMILALQLNEDKFLPDVNTLQKEIKQEANELWEEVNKALQLL